MKMHLSCSEDLHSRHISMELQNVNTRDDGNSMQPRRLVKITATGLLGAAFQFNPHTRLVPLEGEPTTHAPA